MKVHKTYDFDQSDYDSINEAVFNGLGYEIKNNQVIESYWNVLPDEIKLDAEKWGVSDTEVQEKMVGWYRDNLLPKIKQMVLESNMTPDEKIKQEIAFYKAKIDVWDELAKDNEGNKHNLSTSERQDWVDKISDLGDYFC